MLTLIELLHLTVLIMKFLSYPLIRISHWVLIKHFHLPVVSIPNSPCCFLHEFKIFSCARSMFSTAS